MTKSTKGFLILMTPFLLGFLMGLLVGGGCSRKEEPSLKTNPDQVQEFVAENEEEDDAEASAVDASDSYEEPQMREIIYYAPRISYAKTFNDLNEDHLQLAANIGLKKIPSNRDDVKVDGLVHITDNNLYVIEELRYSVPYLTKGGASELQAIAQAFSDSLKSKELLDYKLVVSSVLRTEEDVDKLRRSGNPNASDKSAHCYGTTFDITYTRYHRDEETDAFMQPYELTKVLAEVLRDQKAAGRCLVKYEKKEHCFHITSRLTK